MGIISERPWSGWRIRGCHPDAALVDSLLKAVENQEGNS
jgi:hypothetical protein